MVIDNNGREGSREQERFQSLTESRRRPSRHHVVLQTVPSGGSTTRKARRPTLDRLTYGTNKRSWSVRTRDLREWLATSPFLPFPSVHSHSRDASDLIPIPVQLSELIPIPSHCHSRLTRHLSLNDQTISVQNANTQLSSPTNVILSVIVE